MAERGATPQIPRLGRRALLLAQSFTSPLLPDDYIELINPLWSTRELRGRVERVEAETDEAVTITIKPGWEWPGHKAGQYIRLGIEVDGRFHWRAYSLTSEPGRADGCITITPKLVHSGTVTPYLCGRLRPGAIVRLGGVEGTFVLPDPLPERILFISAGSGVTPIASMLRSLDASGSLRDAVHIHSARYPHTAIFADELRELAGRRPGYRLTARHSGAEGRITPDELDAICPDWRERETFVCGPSGLLAAIKARFEADGDPGRLHHEHFQPDALIEGGEHGCGGAIKLCKSGLEASSDGSEPILVAGERAGAEMPFGCRMGICHSCVGRLRAGRVRDLRTGEVSGSPGAIVRTCVNAPEGPVEIEL
ncbi:MAG TPA: 2Fe-2S iron-sulfur cluster-binding protein [Solirubrobacteraceae bacterium]|nr:2Fe-2S iron-sulfur cluster-binding protein [Solirubrobacteraceae bacterium]